MENVSNHTKQMDIQYQQGLKKFFSIYLDTVSSTEPQFSATPKLITYLLYKKNDKRLQLAGCCRIHVQPTAMSQWRKGAPRGSKLIKIHQNLLINTISHSG